VLKNLGFVNSAKNDLVKAENFFKKALAIYKRLEEINPRYTKEITEIENELAECHKQVKK